MIREDTKVRLSGRHANTENSIVVVVVNFKFPNLNRGISAAIKTFIIIRINLVKVQGSLRRDGKQNSSV